MFLSGSDILVKTLIEQGCDTVFGYPGGQILNVYDSLYTHQDKITHILTAHEQGAAHAADGFARATGKPGVCLATSGQRAKVLPIVQCLPIIFGQGASGVLVCLPYTAGNLE